MRAEQAQARLRRPCGLAKPGEPEAGHCRAPQRPEGILGARASHLRTKSQTASQPETLTKPRLQSPGASTHLVPLLGSLTAGPSPSPFCIKTKGPNPPPFFLSPASAHPGFPEQRERYRGQKGCPFPLQMRLKQGGLPPQGCPGSPVPSGVLHCASASEALSFCVQLPCPLLFLPTSEN